MNSIENVDVDAEAENLLTMKPEFRKDTKQGKTYTKKANASANINSRCLLNNLTSAKSNTTNLRSSDRLAASTNKGSSVSLNEKDSAQALLSELKNDVNAINNKFSTVCNVLSNCIDRIDDLECEVQNTNDLVSQHDDQISKIVDDLEYYKRKERQNQVLFTCSILNTAEPNLKNSVCKILRNSLKLSSDVKS